MMNLGKNVNRVEVSRAPLWMAAALCFSIHALAAQTAGIAPGQLVERLEVRADSSQSYAVYLPKSYSAGVKWPIFYCFDPGARGSLPVRLFKNGAEKYGYIVVGSNNSRNGPNVAISSIVQSLWTDTHERFAVDDSRVFAAGFSGGARVATAFGMSYKESVIGVVACSGGFPSRLSPSKDTQFAWFGTAGTDDFNNPEMQQLDRVFASLNKPRQLALFDGSHDWPPEAVCTRAIEWMEVQSMLIGRKEKNDSEIEGFYQKWKAEAEALDSAGRLYQSFAAYSQLADSFKAIKDSAEINTKLAALKTSKEVRSAVKAESELEDRQSRRSREFLEIRASMSDPDKKTEALSSLKSTIAELKKSASRPEQSPERMLGRRMVSLFFVESSERATNEMFQKRYGDAVIDYSICVELQPENARPHFNLAKAYYSVGDLKKAREFLKLAVDRGFSDEKALEDFRKQLAQ